MWFKWDDLDQLIYRNKWISDFLYTDNISKNNFVHKNCTQIILYTHNAYIKNDIKSNFKLILSTSI